MDQLREKEIFEAATEKLDVYVPACLKQDEVEDAKDFLKPCGPYVRFALKEFVKKLLGELIRPAGERKRASETPDLEPIYETIKRELPEHYGVRRGLIGYMYSEFVEVTISELLSFRIKREDVRYLIFAVCVRGYDEDDDGDWMGLVAEELEDELLELAANGDVGEGCAWFSPDQTEEFCRAAEYIYRNYGRYLEMAENKARMQREKYGL